MAATILIVDDEETIRHFLAQFFRGKGFEVVVAENGAEAIRIAEAQWLDVVLLDLKLPDLEGVEVLRQLRQENPDLPVIMMTAFGEVPSAVGAMRLGAYDYMAKPLNLEQVGATVDKALESALLRQEIRRLREAAGSDSQMWVRGESRAMRPVVFTVERVKTTDASIVLQGESGTGKEIVANYIHLGSPRGAKRMIPINCAAIPDSLLESELFGYEAGAFTGAKKMKKGLFELADGSTLFLDEIGSMKEDLQAKLLRVVESRTFTRLGGTKPIHINVRYIAATNRNLQHAMAEGKFREDLFYRLGVFLIHLPPLRERKPDIKIFIATFLTEFHKRWGRPIPHVSGEALELLENYAWPGNTRELRNVVERAMILCDGDEITPAHLPQDIAGTRAYTTRAPESPPAPANNGHGKTFVEKMAEHEKALLAAALERAQGDLEAAAKELALSVGELQDKATRYGLA